MSRVVFNRKGLQLGLQSPWVKNSASGRLRLSIKVRDDKGRKGA